MAQLIVLDGSAVPTPEHYREWAGELLQHGFRHLRTGALAPRQATQAERAGLHCVQELVLLDVSAPLRPPAARHRTRRLRRHDFAAAAIIDRDAFGARWALDAEMLADIRHATPSHRVRGVLLDDRLVGFLVSGRAARVGYVQRLAVDPAQHRQGVATALLGDSFRWMERSRVRRAFVNTHVENEAARELYRRHGFTELPERLRVFEGALA